jgi:catechol 2,3-dioxygenase-like lactoylglutathione lyase family enzyme
MLSRVRANLIWVRDVAASKVWYQHVLGFMVVEDYADEGFLRMRLGESEFFIEHHNPKIHPAFHGRPGGRHSFILEAPELEKAVQEIREKGGTIVQPPIQQFYGGWNAIVADPDGNEFVLIEAAGDVQQQQQEWPPHLDAVAAAPGSHIVLSDNDAVRILRVVIAPGHKEPAHTHEWPSTFILVRAARIRYYDANEQIQFETDGSAIPFTTEWVGPEGLHAVENIDSQPYEALRIEYKKWSEGA